MPPANTRHVKGSPLTPHVKTRVAELIGMGLSHVEAGGACNVSEKSVERILVEPEYRKLADDIKQRHRTSMGVEAAQAVRDLLTAVDKDGNPDLAKRAKGAELYARNPERLDAVDDDDDDTGMLPGVVLRFPHPSIPDEAAPVIFTEDDLVSAEVTLTFRTEG